MKKAILPLIILLAATTAFSQDHGDKSGSSAPINNWIKYNSPDGRYSVNLPRPPKLSSQESTNDDGLKFTQYIASSEGSEGLCMIGYFDFPVAFDLDKARDSIVQRLNATLAKESVVSLGGHPGREIKLATKAADGSQFVVQARIYVVKQRAYFVQFITPGADTTTSVDQLAARYFDSFSVTVP